jgi:hypothetical protein
MGTVVSITVVGMLVTVVAHVVVVVAVREADSVVLSVLELTVVDDATTNVQGQII